VKNLVSLTFTLERLLAKIVSARKIEKDSLKSCMGFQKEPTKRCLILKVVFVPSVAKQRITTLE
jgi:hypothetical protein